MALISDGSTVKVGGWLRNTEAIHLTRKTDILATDYFRLAANCAIFQYKYNLQQS